MHQIISKIENILTIYDFETSDVSERLLCIFCKKLLRNACQTPCGCKGCKICFNIYLEKEDKPCPSNSIDCENMILNMNENIYLDNATNKEISCLILKCTFNICVYRDMLKNMVIHIDNCEYKETKCDQCLEMFVKKDQKFHDDNICEMRVVKCPHCSQSIIYKNLNSIHLNTNNDNLCIKLFGYCPNKCSVKHEVLLRDHLLICPNKLINCPFNFIGCQIEKQNKKDMLKHFDEENINHMDSLINKISALQSEIEVLVIQIKSLKEISNELFAINQKSIEGQLKLQNSIEELKKIDSTGKQINCENVIFRNGSFIWKILDFSAKKQEAANGGTISFISPPFYTSEFGYKLCMKIYPNGDGIGKETHLSVFFVIMKGEFDDILSWPFKQKVTLGILDQDGSGKSISDTFKPDIRSTCYQKPTDEFNIASGSPKFVLISKLMGNSPYCKNNIILFENNS